MKAITSFTRLLFRVVVVGTASLLTTSVALAGYVYTEVSRPGAAITSLWDINNNGQMVGFSQTGTGASEALSAFIYDGVSFTSIAGPSGAISTTAHGISDTGLVVGSYALDIEAGAGVVLGSMNGYIYNTTSGFYTTLTVAGANDTFLRGISSDGRFLTGYYTTDTQAGIGFVYEMPTGIFRTTSLSASQLTIAQGVNNAGMVVGSDILSGPPTTRPGFFYDAASATRTDVAIAVAERTALRAIDEAGVVAGWFIDGSAVTHGFVGSVTSYEQIDFTGATGTFVEGSNNDGVLVGNFLLAEGGGAFIAYRVPEPASLALVGIASAGLAAVRRRQRTTADS